MRWLLLILSLLAPGAYAQVTSPPGLAKSANLSDVPDKNAGLTNLGLRYASNRAPLPTDDTAHGNLPTSLWLNPLDGAVYNMADGTANNASWTKMIVPATPGNAGGTPLASYGVCRVVGAYTGNLFTLTRTSDSTTLAAPQGVDTCVNPAPLDAFCANTTCFVSTLNDQSGNGFDCVGVAATGPSWMPNAAINGRRAIRWAAIPHTLLSQTATFKFCTAAGVTTWNPGAYSFVFAGQFAMTSAGPSTLFTDSTSGFGWASSGNVNQRVAIVYGTGATLGVAIPATPVVVGYTAANGAGGNKLSVNNDYAAVFGSVIAAKTGLIIGGSAAYQRMDMLSLTLYATPLTAPQMLSVRASAAAQFKIPPQCCDVVVSVHGDSLLTGDGALTGVPLPTRAVAMQNVPVKLYNFTVFGNTLLGAAPAILAAAQQDLTLVWSPNARLFLEVIEGGANDIRAGTLAPALISGLQGAIPTLRSGRPNLKIMVTTTPLQTTILGNPTYLAQLQQTNDFAIANYNVPAASNGYGGDFLMNLWGNPLVGMGNYTTSAFANANCGILEHMTDLCQGWLAGTAAAAIMDAIK